tara:strand:- start:2180 stop:3106 length:927 start_codon:yes stop_codon:yes gene_type:complete
MTSTSHRHLKIAGIGEILRDLFPNASHLGGAPANFAYHCDQLGATSYLVSSIGTDKLGLQTSAELQRRGTNLRYVSELPGLATGRVNVTLDHQQKPTYDIQTDVAWDQIPFTAELKELASQLDAACFGTLAQRSPTARESIRTFIRHMPAQSLKILDINLRAPFYSESLVEESLELANVLKLSDEELPTLAEFFSLSGSTNHQLSTLLNRFDLKFIAFTRGAKGSILLDRDQSDECPVSPLKVVDSVGAGDSFTAAFCVGLLSDWPLSEINMFANRVAASVCSQHGPTPKLPTHLSEKTPFKPILTTS